MATTGVSSKSNAIDDIIAKTEKNSTTRKTGGDLGKNDFLNLLVTQLRYQDPLKPTEDKEFIAQMAQFSSLEQMQNMNGSMSKSEAFGLVGKYVTATKTDESTKEVTEVKGQVSSVKMSEGKVYLTVDNKDVEIDNVTKVEDANFINSRISDYANLIGYNARGAVYDSASGDMIYLSGDVSEIQKGLNEDYAVMDNVNVTIAEVTGSTSTAANYTKDYLEQHIGKKVSVTIKDVSSGCKVPVTATLKSYTIAPNGTITGVLDDLNMSVDSVANIKKTATQV